MYYVSMTDKFMSGWGMAEGKLNKLVISCNTAEEANMIGTFIIGGIVLVAILSFFSE